MDLEEIMQYNLHCIRPKFLVGIIQNLAALCSTHHYLPDMYTCTNVVARMLHKRKAGVGYKSAFVLFLRDYRYRSVCIYLSAPA
jgi:hypothetical protein